MRVKIFRTDQRRLEKPLVFELCDTPTGTKCDTKVVEVARIPITNYTFDDGLCHPNGTVFVERRNS